MSLKETKKIDTNRHQLESTGDGEKFRAAHAALPPIAFVFLPEWIGRKQENSTEGQVQQGKWNIPRDKTENHTGYEYDAKY